MCSLYSIYMPSFEVSNVAHLFHCFGIQLCVSSDVIAALNIKHFRLSCHYSNGKKLHIKAHVSGCGWLMALTGR